MKILILNEDLKKKSIDYIRPRYIQMSKNDTVGNLKEKIKRCLKELFENKLTNKKQGANNTNVNKEKETFTFKNVNLYSIIYGMKKKKREILKLIYSYSENTKRYNISGDALTDDNITLDVNKIY